MGFLVNILKWGQKWAYPLFGTLTKTLFYPLNGFKSGFLGVKVCENGSKLNSVQTRCIVKGEAQKSPLFWRFSGGF